MLDVTRVPTLSSESAVQPVLLRSICHCVQTCARVKYPATILGACSRRIPGRCHKALKRAYVPQTFEARDCFRRSPSLSVKTTVSLDHSRQSRSFVRRTLTIRLDSCKCGLKSTQDHLHSDLETITRGAPRPHPLVNFDIRV